MQNVVDLWLGLDVRRKAAVIFATLAVFAAILAMSAMTTRPDMALLYAGLEGAESGEVLAALEQRGAAYEVRGDSIFVEAAARDQLRMELAAQGLPEIGGEGYELLDGLTGFGTTSQMFDAAYWRAKEGELARTILATPGVRSVRVHIAHAPSQPFQQDRRASAAVTVTMASGSLSEPQARALKHLVASAVNAMQPEDVSVIDSVRGLIGEYAGPVGADGSAENQAKLLKDRVLRLLEARVGAGRAVVEVTVELATERETINEKTFDPQGRVAISTEMSETSGTSSAGEESVTVASNLPEGDAGPGAQNRSQNAESRERVNYEVSETARELIREPGAIRRLSVAVLVDGDVTSGEGEQAALQPRSEEELSALKELVASAVGFDASRGDQLTLKSLAFEPVAEQGTTAEGGSGFSAFDVMTLAKIGILGLVATLLGVFVVRPALLSRRGPDGIQANSVLALPAAGETSPPVLSGEIQDIGDLPDLPIVSGKAEEVADDPVARLRRLIDARQAESVQILRGWLEREEEA